MKPISKIMISLIFSTFIAAPVWAAKVKAVKGKKAQIDLQGDSAKVGDTFSVVDESGKTVGAVKITAIKGTLAIAMLKGKAPIGAELKSKAASKAKKSMAKKQKDTGTTRSSRFGAMVGFNSTSSDVTITSSGTDETLSLSGSGFSAKGFYDYNLMGSFWFRGLFGLEQFNIGGETNTECGSECIAEINYLSADLWGRLTFGMGWIGGGFSLLIPMSKKTTAFDEESIATTSAISIGGGVDIEMGSRIFPIQFEYNMYPETERVTASAIALRAGMSF